MENPDLLRPGMDPNDPRSKVVPSLPRFRSRDEFGNLVESTKPLPTKFVEEWEYYFCPVPNASMHRTDGKRIGFVGGVFATNIQADIDFMEREIADDHPHLRHATEAEIKAYQMRMDPKGTMRRELLDDPELARQVEERVRANLETEIRAKLLREMGMETSPLSVTEGVEGAADAAKLAGTSSPLDRLKQAIKTPTATIIPSVAPPVAFKPTSTADIADAAASSGR